MKTDVEAIAEIILKFKNNILGRIHLDFIRREYKRSAEILCENGIISWSLKEGTFKIFNAKYEPPSASNNYHNVKLLGPGGETIDVIEA